MTNKMPPRNKSTLTTAALLLSAFTSLASAAYQWPSQPYDDLEDFIYSGQRPDGSSMSSLVASCKLRGTTNTTVAAEWTRFVYHDTSTHNITDGTGGLDGSLFFELDRVENVGAGMTNTRSDFSSFPSKYISRSDITVIGTIFAVAACGGPAMQVRGGRIDTNVAGPYGVPNASDTSESIVATFAHQGFNISEMIQLVACGHTLGGVRYPDFPDVVAAPSDTSETVVDLFDDTQQFDHNIVTNYLDGTTRDPLIVLNQTMASDLKVFSQDPTNATLQAMSSADTFSSTCVSIFDKMFNTVPNGVNLTDYIELQPVKVGNVQLTLGDSNLEFQAAVRVSTVSDNTNISMYWCDKYGSSADCAGGLKRYASPVSSTTVGSTVASAMGVTLEKYQFVVPIDADQGINKFWFDINYGNGTTAVADNNGAYYPVAQDEVLWVPSMSIAKSATSTNGSWFIVAAVKSSSASDISGLHIDCIGRATADYIAVNATYDLALNNTMPSKLGYDFYSVATTANFGVTMQFDIVAEASNGTQWIDGDRQAGLISITLPAASGVNTTTSKSVGGSGESAAWSWRHTSAGWLVGVILVVVAAL
ncbi:Peroxidase [Mycena chlorophos]|uniref:Peroxidase n=1 Tax=Mycena chlorophos TaxID=658473 RepID=A0A8H6SKE6_MYCCL|nr:Peroxidase [Mycena chlorophos]